MKKTICCTLAGVFIMGSITGCGGDSKKSGAPSEEKAVRNFVFAFLNADIDGMLSASAPEEFWDFYADMTGLTKERFVYQLANVENENEFQEEVDESNKYYENDEIRVEDNKIEEKYEMNNEDFSVINLAMQHAGVGENVEEVYWVDINYYSDGVVYLIDEKWYYGPEWLIEDAVFEIYDLYEG